MKDNITAACNARSFFRGARVVSTRFAGRAFVVACLVITVLTLVWSGMLALGSLLGVVRPLVPSPRDYGLWAVGTVVAGVVYVKLGRSVGWREATGLYGSLFLASGGFAYVVWISRHVPPMMFEHVGEFVWPTGISLAVRLGLLPVQLGCGALLLGSVLMLIQGLFEGAKALCALGKEAGSDSN